MKKNFRNFLKTFKFEKGFIYQKKNKPKFSKIFKVFEKLMLNQHFKPMLLLVPVQTKEAPQSLTQ